MKRITNLKSFILYIAIVMGIIVFANLISRTVFFRWDWTDGNIYTLSESSKSIVTKVDDRLLAKVYFSDNLPGQYANNRRFLQDMLEEFRAYSTGKFHFEFYRPEEDGELEQEAQRYGIPPVQLQAIENDRMEIKNVWMGIALLYEDKREIIPVIQTTAGLEYQLASSIKKLIDVDKRTVGIVSAAAGDEQNRNVRDLLQQTYTVRNVDLDNSIPFDIDLLLVNQVTDSLSETALFNLDQYIMSGRPVFLAQNAINAELNRGFATRINNNLLDALKYYGLEVTGNLVVDRVASQIGVETQRGIFRMRNAVDYPFFPLIRRFNKDNLVVAGLEQIRLFFTSELASSIDSTRLATTTFEPLLFTSDRSNVAQGPRYNINYQNNPAFAMLNGPGRIVSALLSGELHSVFTEENLPAGSETFQPSTMGGRLLVVGGGDFFSDEAGGSIPENLNLIINAVDYLVGDEDLIAVRSREVTARPLKELEDGTRRTLKWANIFGPAVLIVATGLWRWRGSR
ncbi:MAG: GldG family protein, partial [Candidatus Marinimicrobia bacterium]|nr:GldG family protein [Candidatus Neomarinimicrobiota bacterium]